MAAAALKAKAIGQSTTVEIDGVASVNIGGWTLTFTMRGVCNADVTKVSTDPTQLEILDAVNGTFAVYLSATDTKTPGIFNVQVRAVDAVGNEYLLVRDVLVVSP